MSVTITNIAGTDAPKNSRSVINTNFSNLKSAVEVLQANGSSGNGSSVLRDALANIPSASSVPDGTMFFPDLGVYTYISDGTNWFPYLDGWTKKVNEPKIGDFTVIHAGVTSTDSTYGGLAITATQTDSSTAGGMTLLMKSLPATSGYTLTTAVRFHILQDGQYPQLLPIVLRESSSGKIVIFSIVCNYGSPYLCLFRYDDYTMSNQQQYGSTNGQVFWGIGATTTFWTRVVVTTTGTRTWYYSRDGLYWVRALWCGSAAYNDFCTPDQWGFGMHPANNDGNYRSTMAIHLLHSDVV